MFRNVAYIIAIRLSGCSYNKYFSLFELIKTSRYGLYFILKKCMELSPSTNDGWPKDGEFRRIELELEKKYNQCIKI